ncbi:MAG: hypothetical protein WCF90_02680 [Methanomicrobiales archaeon]
MTPGLSHYAIVVRNETVIPAPTALAIETTVTIPTSITTISTSSHVYTARTTVPSTAEATEVPAGPTVSSGIPVSTVLIGAVAIVLIVGGGLLARRWWIRRQNPALLRNYD